VEERELLIIVTIIKSIIIYGSECGYTNGVYVIKSNLFLMMITITFIEFQMNILLKAVARKYIINDFSTSEITQSIH
jgi:hypothetical protein